MVEVRGIARTDDLLFWQISLSEAATWDNQFSESG